MKTTRETLEKSVEDSWAVIERVRRLNATTPRLMAGGHDLILESYDLLRAAERTLREFADTYGLDPGARG